jgi:hypothetical protein
VIRVERIGLIPPVLRFAALSEQFRLLFHRRRYRSVRARHRIAYRLQIQSCVDFRRCGRLVPQALADNRQAGPETGLPTPLRSPQVVDAEICDLRAFKEFFPSAVQVLDVPGL